ncbi:MAG: helix-turn-helix transcriptional regulator [Ruminiclostridium sp.]|nr:helix-turn-helix transcriptional regulator [Ruminiclostridium sp.]
MTKLYEGNHHILIRTGYADPIQHRHMAAHIIISTVESMRATVNGRNFICPGIMTPSGVPHVVETNGQSALVFLFDNTTTVARQIHELTPLPETDCADILVQFRMFERQETADAYQAFLNFLLSKLGLGEAQCCVTDDRIISSIHRSSEGLSCPEAARLVHLSQGRFSHLFKAQTGLSFSSYLLYQKTMAVYAGILRGQTITEAAMDAGFSSPSHFADVHRRLFGLSASQITKDLTYTRVR